MVKMGNQLALQPGPAVKSLLALGSSHTGTTGNLGGITCSYVVYLDSKMQPSSPVIVTLY